MLLAVRFRFSRAWIPALYAVILFGCPGVHAATFTVTSANNGGAGSLRVAISNANFFAGTDLINFNISGTGPFAINLTTALPPLTEPATIDGTTQPGYVGKPRIELNGTSAGSDATGIYLQTSDCIVKGLAINRFTKEGIRIEGTGSNTIQGNFIGTGPFGTNSLGNGSGSGGFGGITILSAGNLIGGTDATNRNIISGSNLHGIFLLGASAIANQIVGNYIGLDVTGTKRLGNIKNGITTSGVKNTIIGGTNATARNVISGNYESGIYLLSNLPVNVNSISNVIQGNFIGTDNTGTVALSNILEGITLEGATFTMIGGTNAGARNVISGNGGRGIAIDANGATGNIIQGNFIGTDVSGTAGLGNGYTGVDIFNSSSNIVGGAAAGARNVISANGLSGISISDTNCTANVIQGNFLGTDVTGTNALGNSRNGVFLAGVTNNLIGGTNSGEGNLISGNVQNGVHLADAGGRNNLVQGNFIGTVSNGLAALGNLGGGVYVENAPGNTIGGTTTGARNLISGNTGPGVAIFGIAASGNVVRGNFIGPDLTGTIPLPNGSGAGVQGTPIGGGIDIADAPLNLIGGTEAGAGNLISGNYRDGICIGDAGASNNVVQGNLIGTQANGVSPLGNETHNIDIRIPGGANNNLIGGSTPEAGNVIAFLLTPGPGYDGIRVRDGNVGNLVRGNSIFDNGTGAALALGIDLGVNGVTANDDCDGDTGGNQVQNFPVLTNVLSGGSATRIQGTLNSTANSTYLVQFYANTVVAASGYGEGKTYIGSTNIITGGSCNVAFSVVIPTAVQAGRYITATATDPANNTSEFSAAVVVATAQLPAISSQPQSQSVPFGSNVTFSVTASGTGPLMYQWRFKGTNIAGATASSLPLLNVQLTNAGNYDVSITNLFGSTNSATATLTVQFNAPSLSVQKGGSGQVLISWPTNGPSFTLQETTNLTPPSVWSNTTNVAVVTNSQFVVAITPTFGNRFYRLALP